MAASDLPLHIRQQIEHKWVTLRKRLEECTRSSIGKGMEGASTQEPGARPSGAYLSDESAAH